MFPMQKTVIWLCERFSRSLPNMSPNFRRYSILVTIACSDQEPADLLIRWWHYAVGRRARLKDPECG